MTGVQTCALPISNLAVLIPFTVVGALFAWGFEASGSLWTSIAAHVLVNGLGFAATLAQLAGGE